MRVDPRQTQLSRGIWIWATREVVNSSSQIAELIAAAKAIGVTDVYLHVPPECWLELRDALIAFNTQAHHNKLRVWALDGDQAYTSHPTAEERFLDGLRALVELNATTPRAAHFHGFQALVELEDTTPRTPSFHNGLAMSQLDQEQTTQRDMVLHKWLNVHTRASAFLRSYDLPFSAALPHWLIDYEGEPVTTNWVNASTPSCCVMDLIMPLVDEYIVLSAKADPARIAARTLGAVRYSSALLLKGQEMPRVLASLHVPPGGPKQHSSGDESLKESSSITTVKDMTSVMTSVERLLEKYDGFGGMMIHDWAAWRSLPA